MQLALLFRQTVDRLRQAGIEEPESDAFHLFSFTFGLSRSAFFLRGHEEADPEKHTLLESLLQRRLTREPLQYITGTWEFWSLDFLVSPAVLIPRPETEFMLDRALALIRAEGLPEGPVVDMCTGSGAIAVVLSMELERGVVAVDSSASALAVAAENVMRHGQAGTVSLLGSDLFAGIRQGQRFACCVSNPPYISEQAFAALQPEVREWEPKSALLAGGNGLYIIARLSETLPGYLLPDARVFIEIGADQGEAAYALFTGPDHPAYYDVQVLEDWSGRPRVLQARVR